MLGAREYATLFKSGQYGRLYIESGEHARGKTFAIWILPSCEPLQTNPRTSSSAVQVYGITGGNPGWTETYGWLHRGKWEQDFYTLVEARRAEIATDLVEQARRKKDREAKESAYRNSLLAAYEVSTPKIGLRNATVGPAFPENSEAASSSQNAKAKIVEVLAEDLLDLIKYHDCWAGSFEQDEAEEWCQKYASLRELAERCVAGTPKSSASK